MVYPLQLYQQQIWQLMPVPVEQLQHFVLVVMSVLPVCIVDLLLVNFDLPVHNL